MLLAALNLTGCRADFGPIRAAGGKTPNAPYEMSMRMDPDPPVIGRAVTLRLKVREVGKTDAITDFEYFHARIAHLILVSRDLREFQHLYPELSQDGTLTVTTVLPPSRDFRIYLETVPIQGGGSHAITTADFTASGDAVTAPKLDLDQAPKTVEGVQISLRTDPQELKMEGGLLNFDLEAGHKPLKDVQSYLGAGGDCVAIGEGAMPYLHIYPMDDPTASNSYGPIITFHAVFPSAGRYKIWGQFLHADKILIAPFVVDVK